MKTQDNNKVAVVTAGAQGIGRVCVLTLLRGGYDVAALDCDKEALKDLVRVAGVSGRRLATVCCDVGHEKAIRQAIRFIERRFKAVDCLINNAGIGKSKPLTDLKLSEWNRVLAVNLTSVFLMVKSLLPLFRNGKGVVVNIASTRALMSEANTEAYSASKGAVVSLTHALAVSHGPGIRVNCISPGWIDTTLVQKKGGRPPAVLSKQDHLQHPAGRVGTPEDIAEMALYLLSNKASFITGQNFTVDGGMTRKMIYV